MKYLLQFPSRPTKSGRGTVYSHGSSIFIPRPQITDCAARVGKRSTATKALDESADKDRADIRCYRYRYVEDNEDEPRPYVYRITTPVFR